MATTRTINNPTSEQLYEHFATQLASIQRGLDEWTDGEIITEYWSESMARVRVIRSKDALQNYTLLRGFTFLDEIAVSCDWQDISAEAAIKVLTSEKRYRRRVE